MTSHQLHLHHGHQNDPHQAHADQAMAADHGAHAVPLIGLALCAARCRHCSLPGQSLAADPRPGRTRFG